MANLFLFTMCLSLHLNSVFADETTKIYPSGGAADLLNVTKTPDYIGGPEKPQGTIILNHECADTNGKVFKKDDAGYDACLKNRMEDQKKKGGKGRSGALSPGAAQPTQAAPPAVHPPHVPTGI